MARLTWRGPEVKAKMIAATALAVDKTMAECVSHAKDFHPAYPPASEPYTRFANRTAFLVNSIQILDGAKLEGTIVSGKWGSEADYALYLEIGTSILGPTAQERAASAAGNELLIPPPIGPLMAPRPYLRPALDISYPKLAPTIAAIFKGES